MIGFIGGRLVAMLVSAWLIGTIVFFLARITGDPLALLIPDDATAEEERVIRDRYGLDDPLPQQYVGFLADIARFDMGHSIRHSEPALQAVLRYMPATIELAVVSLVIAVLFGVSTGIIAAVRAGSIFELFAMIGALLGQAVPGFWLGLMLIMVFGVRLDWLPISGRGGLTHLIMPAIVLGTAHMAAFSRLTRAAMLEHLGQDYTRTGRAKGLHETRVVLGHALPNAAIPIVTQIGLSFGRMLAGSVITETIFAWPGVGRFALQAVNNRDFPVIQASVLVVGIIFLVINFLMDVLYAWLDPRIRLR